MTEKVTLEDLAAEMRKGFVSFEKRFTSVEKRIEKGFASVEKRIEKGFAAVAEDISGLATKEDAIALQTQVNSIERQLRETNAQVRLADLEEEVFGKARA